MSIEIANESGVEVDEAALAAVARFVLDELGINPLAELSVLLVDVDAMAACTCSGWASPARPTCWPSRWTSWTTARGPGRAPEPGPTLLGDVVLCPAVAAAAGRAGRPLAGAELHLLTVHGILHLLGYDHAEPEEEREMFGLQAELARLGGLARGRRASAGHRPRQRSADGRLR